MDKLLLLSADEQRLRLQRVYDAMRLGGIAQAIIADKANIYYLTGRVFSGYVYLTLDQEPVYLVKRPVALRGDRVIEIRKPENIIDHIALVAGPVGFELNTLPYAQVVRLSQALGGVEIADASCALSQARSVKTAVEVAMMRQSGAKHESVYRRIPLLYQPGMTDVELQVEIERQSRLEGCLGQFRIAGTDMELFMGNILAGDNADAPSPYDFAMGGAGADPSLPVGANGTVIRPGMAVMVDMNGNFNGYMTDMTRCYSLGTISDEAQLAHQVSIDICRALETMGRPGTAAKDLYDRAYEIAREAGLEAYFMGHRQHAGFVGHGVGIEVNEQPVLAPRSRDILAEGNTIAIEPKFVIPGAGAVGIENTYLVTADGLQSLTHAPEAIIPLDK